MPTFFSSRTFRVALFVLVVAAIFVIVFAPHFPYCCGTSPRTAFSNYLEALGYSFYNPPRTDRGPGSVFRYEKSESGKLTIAPVCTGLFPNLETHEAELTLPEEKATEDVEVNFFLGLLSDLWKDPSGAKAQLKSDASISAIFQRPISIYFAEEAVINEEGEARSISPACYSRLKKLKEGPNQLNNVFVVQDAVQVSRATYEISTRSLSSGNAELAMQSILNFKGGVKSSRESQLRFEVTSPRFVAYKAFVITNYHLPGTTSAGAAVIQTRKLSLGDFEH